MPSFEPIEIKLPGFKGRIFSFGQMKHEAKLTKILEDMKQLPDLRKDAVTAKSGSRILRDFIGGNASGNNGSIDEQIMQMQADADRIFLGYLKQQWDINTLLTPGQELTEGTSPAVFRALKAVLSKNPELLRAVISASGLTSRDFDNICMSDRTGGAKRYSPRLEMLSWFSMMQQAGLEEGINYITGMGEALGNVYVLGDTLSFLKSQDVLKNFSILNQLAKQIHPIKEVIPQLLVEGEEINAVSVEVVPNRDLLASVRDWIVREENKKLSRTMMGKESRGDGLTKITANIDSIFRLMETVICYNGAFGARAMLEKSEGSENVPFPPSFVTLRSGVSDKSAWFTTFYKTFKSSSPISVDGLSDWVLNAVDTITDGDRKDLKCPPTSPVHKAQTVGVLKPEIWRKGVRSKEILDEFLSIFRKNGWEPTAASVISGPYLADQGWDPYRVMEDLSEKGAEAFSPMAKETFEKLYKCKWESVKDKIYGASRFTREKGIPPEDILIQSDRAASSKLYETQKISDEIYCNMIDFNGETYWLVNNFAFKLGYFKQPGHKTLVILFEQMEGGTPLNEMKDFFGGVNPRTAIDGSFRRGLSDNSWYTRVQVNTFENGCKVPDNHAEAMGDISNYFGNEYFGLTLEKTKLGKSLIDARLSLDHIKAMAENLGTKKYRSQEGTPFELTDGKTFEEVVEFAKEAFLKDAVEVKKHNTVILDGKPEPIRVSLWDVMNLPATEFTKPIHSENAYVLFPAEFSLYEAELSLPARWFLGLESTHKTMNLKDVLEDIYLYQEERGLLQRNTSKYFIEKTLNASQSKHSSVFNPRVWTMELAKVSVVGTFAYYLFHAASGLKLMFPWYITLGLLSMLFAGLVKVDRYWANSTKRLGNFYDCLQVIENRPTVFNKKES